MVSGLFAWLTVIEDSTGLQAGDLSHALYYTGLSVQCNIVLQCSFGGLFLKITIGTVGIIRTIITWVIRIVDFLHFKSS